LSIEKEYCVYVCNHTAQRLNDISDFGSVKTVAAAMSISLEASLEVGPPAQN
jgi:hypothetical protein